VYSVSFSCFPFLYFYAFLLFSLSCLWAKLPDSNKRMYVCINEIHKNNRMIGRLKRTRPLILISYLVGG